MGCIGSFHLSPSICSGVDDNFLFEKKLTHLGVVLRNISLTPSALKAASITRKFAQNTIPLQPLIYFSFVLKMQTASVH